MLKINNEKAIVLENGDLLLPNHMNIDGPPLILKNQLYDNVIDHRPQKSVDIDQTT